MATITGNITDGVTITATTSPGTRGLQGAAGVVQSIVAGANTTVDNTDPAHPIVSSSGGGGGGGTWGGITGTLSDQVDLQTALNNRAEKFITIAQTAHGFTAGQWVGLKNGQYALANAAAGGVVDYVGYVASTTTNSFVLQRSGAITDTYLIADMSYYISATTPGTIVGYPPTTVGAISAPVAVAIDQTNAIISIGRPSIVAYTIATSGTNVGNDQIGAGAYQTAQNLADLALLNKNLANKRVRIAMPTYSNSNGVSNMRQLALLYKAAGYYVTYGITGLTGTNNSTTYNAWKAQVPSEALWAFNNNIDCFFIGNEEDWQAQIGGISGISDSTVRSDVLALATTIKTAYPTMAVTYGTAQGTIGAWGTLGTGAMDKIMFNMYGTNLTSFDGDIAYFQSVIGAQKFAVSEWAANHPYKDMVTNYTDPNTGATFTDEGYAAMIASRDQTLKRLNVEAYSFALRFSSNGDSTSDWNYYKANNTFKPGARSFLGGSGGAAVKNAPLALVDNQPMFLNTVRSANISADITNIYLKSPEFGRTLVQVNPGTSVATGLGVVNGSGGTGAGAGVIFAAGGNSSFIGGVSSVRTDTSSNAALVFRTWSNGALTSSSAATGAVILQGTASGSILKVQTAMTVNDANLTIQDNSDATKQLQLQLSGISTATTRTLTVPDANTTIVGTDTTQTLTNKRVTKRSGTTTSSATPTINTDNVDFYSITAQSGNITSMTTNLTGTPTERQTLWLALTATSGTPTITWGASFESSTVTLPTALSTTRLDVALVWNTVTSKWRCVGAV